MQHGNNHVSARLGAGLYFIMTLLSADEMSFILFYFQSLGCNHTTAKAENTIQYMHTWILKDQCVVTYTAPIKQKMHLINTMSVYATI